MGLVPASYKVTARSVSRVVGDGRRPSDRSLKGHEAGVQMGQPRAANHHRKIVAVYRTTGAVLLGDSGPLAVRVPQWAIVGMPHSDLAVSSSSAIVDQIQSHGALDQNWPDSPERLRDGRAVAIGASRSAIASSRPPTIRGVW